MRQLRLLGLVFLTVLVLAGCGSSSGSKSSDPRLAELSYFPAGSPFVLTMATDPNSQAIKQAQALEGRFPIAAFGQSYLMSKLQQLGIDYQSDIRPLFGDPVAVGATTPTLSGAASSQFLLVWTTKDAGKLQSLLKKLGGVQSSGSHDGAKLYSAGSATFALDGATLVFAPTPDLVNAALDRHAHGGGITESEYSRETAGLPQDTLIQAFGNLSTVLAQPSAAKARQVPWIAALRGYGTTVSASSSGLSFRYHLDTTGRPLSSSQLPLAAGSATPSVVGGAPISAGIHDPAQIFSFIEAAEQATSPASYAKFLKRQATTRAKTGVDINSFVGLLTGDLVIASDTKKTIGRVGVSNAGQAAQDLAKLAATPHSLFAHASSPKKLPGGLYAVKRGKKTITFGVVGNQLVAGTVGPAALRAFAAAPAAPASGAQGSLAFRVALTEVLRLTLKQAPPKVAQTILGSLGDITGWTSASPSGLDGSASIAVK